MFLVTPSLNASLWVVICAAMYLNLQFPTILIKQRCPRRQGPTTRTPGLGLPFEDLHSPQNEVIWQD